MNCNFTTIAMHIHFHRSASQGNSWTADILTKKAHKNYCNHSYIENNEIEIILIDAMANVKSPKAHTNTKYTHA